MENVSSHANQSKSLKLFFSQRHCAVEFLQFYPQLPQQKQNDFLLRLPKRQDKKIDILNDLHKFCESSSLLFGENCLEFFMKTWHYRKFNFPHFFVESFQFTLLSFLELLLLLLLFNLMKTRLRLCE